MHEIKCSSVIGIVQVTRGRSPSPEKREGNKPRKIKKEKQKEKRRGVLLQNVRPGPPCAGILHLKIGI